MLGGEGAPFVQAVRSAESFQLEGFGQLSLSIRWPQRQAQYIPAETTRIEFKVFPAASIEPIATQEIARPNGGATGTVSFDRLPAGEVVVTGSAKDANGKIVSAGSVRLAIVANQRIKGGLTLVSTEVPKILSLWPTSGDPGTPLSLFGTGFGSSRNATYSVRVGGVEVPGSGLNRSDDSTLTFTVPPGATNSVVVLTVESKSTASVEVFRTVHSWSLTPSGADLYVPNGVQDFTATARDYQGSAIANPAVSWSVTAQGDATGSLITVSDSQATLTVGETEGSIQVRIGRSSAAVTATVATHPMTFADFSNRLGALGAVAHPPENPSTPEKVALGKRLFFDQGLGSNGAMSCATCHLPSLGWSDGLKRSLGNDGQPLPRHAPSVLNAGLLPGPFFWDGRAATLEVQAQKVFESTKELNRSESDLGAYLTGANYQASFSAVFGSPDLTMDRTTKAIAAFERSVVTSDSAFDRWARGDSSALTLAEKQGLAVFATKGRCIQCHDGPMFTDGKFHNISVLEGGSTLDPGRKNHTGLDADLGAFKTPTLRNIAETAPYFHNGNSATLTDVLAHYEGNFAGTPNIDPQLATPILLSAQQRSDLEAFLRALTGATPSIAP